MMSIECKPSEWWKAKLKEVKRHPTVDQFIELVI